MGWGWIRESLALFRVNLYLVLGHPWGVPLLNCFHSFLQYFLIRDFKRIHPRFIWIFFLVSYLKKSSSRGMKLGLDWGELKHNRISPCHSETKFISFIQGHGFIQVPMTLNKAKQSAPGREWSSKDPWGCKAGSSKDFRWGLGKGKGVDRGEPACDI